MAQGIFTPSADGRYEPTEHARGPWDPRALHGGAPAALIARAFERMTPGAELPIARLAFEFLRPIPFAERWTVVDGGVLQGRAGCVQELAPAGSNGGGGRAAMEHPGGLIGRAARCVSRRFPRACRSRRSPRTTRPRAGAAAARVRAGHA